MDVKEMPEIWHEDNRKEEEEALVSEKETDLWCDLTGGRVVEDESYDPYTLPVEDIPEVR